jgi:hypothetical protein
MILISDFFLLLEDVHQVRLSHIVITIYGGSIFRPALIYKYGPSYVLQSRLLEGDEGLHEAICAIEIQ